MEYERRGWTAADIESYLESIDRVQARRYAQLSGQALEIANDGLRRHLRACDRMEIHPDSSAIREIIDYALSGRQIVIRGAGSPETNADWFPKELGLSHLIVDDAAEMRSIRRSYPADSSIDREEMCGSRTGITMVGITGKNTKEGWVSFDLDSEGL
jgi:hypothetical protein